MPNLHGKPTLKNLLECGPEPSMSMSERIINYPEKSQKHHIGLVSRLAQNVVQPRLRKSTEINKLIESTIKRSAIKDKIDKIINANLKHPVLTKTHNDWEGMYKENWQRMILTRKTLKKRI
jgi:hypothetical protein